MIWADVLGLTGSNSRLIGRDLAFMAVAGVIACYGVVDTNPILIVGAMAVSPDLLPITAPAVGLVGRSLSLAGKAMLTLSLGMAVASGFAAVFAYVQNQRFAAAVARRAVRRPSGEGSLVGRIGAPPTQLLGSSQSTLVCGRSDQSPPPATVADVLSKTPSSTRRSTSTPECRIQPRPSPSRPTAPATRHRSSLMGRSGTGDHRPEYSARVCGAKMGIGGSQDGESSRCAGRRALVGSWRAERY